MTDSEKIDKRTRELYERKMQEYQIELRKKEFLRSVLSDGAYERMMNVKISNHDLYDRVVSSLDYLARSGKLGEQISDEQIYSLLQKMTERRETKIEFHHK